MANNEGNIQARIMFELSQRGCLVWRNETAGAWVGRVIHKTGNQVTLTNARMLKLGLCNGSSDIIGIQPITITPDMVGKTVGVFIAPEVKTKKGRTEDDQKKFALAVSGAGGKAGVLRSHEDVEEFLK